MTHYALANPGRHFLLKSPTQDIVNCAPVEKLADRVYQLFGRQALEELWKFRRCRRRCARPSRSRRSKRTKSRRRCASGIYVAAGGAAANRNGIYVFVNRRLVRDRLILHAIHEAYRNIVPPNVFPAMLLFMDMPDEEVDVNVHPAKIEVRFRQIRNLCTISRATRFARR